MKPIPLTAQQLAVVTFICEFRTLHNFGPSIEEIAAAIGRTKSPAWLHVKELLLMGVLGAEYIPFGNGKTRVREGSLTVANGQKE